VGTGVSSLGTEQAGSEADYSLPSSAESKNTWSYTCKFHTSSSHNASWSAGIISPLPYMKWKVVSDYVSLHIVTINWGRAIAQAVSRWLPTAAARVRTWVRSCGICGGQSGAGTVFLKSTSVSPANSHSTDCSTIIIVYQLGLVQQAKQWPQYQVDSVLPHAKKKHWQ
jgi:hypothetical protein